MRTLFWGFFALLSLVGGWFLYQRICDAHVQPDMPEQAVPASDAPVSITSLVNELLLFPEKEESRASSLECAAPFSLISKRVSPLHWKDRLLVLLTDPSHYFLLEPPVVSASMLQLWVSNQPAACVVAETRLVDEELPMGSADRSVCWDECFSLDVKASSMEEGGYMFSLSFVPATDLSSYLLQPHYHFVLDRSHPIDGKKSLCFKKAILKSIDCLSEIEQFTVSIFDSAGNSLSNQSLPCNRNQQEKIVAFLDHKPRGWDRPITELHRWFQERVQKPMAPHEAHTMILLSDGEFQGESLQQRTRMSHWLQDNSGQIPIYAAAVGENNDLPILDVLSSANRGNVLYSDTYSGFPRKFAKWVLSLRAPIAQEMTAYLKIGEPSSEMEILSTSAPLPYLFLNQPFVLIGKGKQLSDCTIHLEGRNGEQSISITKHISFTAAQPGGVVLRKQYALCQARLLYQKYLETGERGYLKQAQQLWTYGFSYSRR